MSEEELYTKGAKVWLPDSKEVWTQATVVKWRKTDQSSCRQLLLACQNDEEVVVEINNAGDFPPLVNPDILLGENDLTKLSYLHEPAVLHNLKTRFTDLQQIYTYCGIVLVALNPYQAVPIYSREMMSAYHQLNTHEADPHIFAIAEEALRRISSPASKSPVNQSVVISGESGAGKTVSAKYILRYLTSVSGSDNEVERRVLASNPILEAIGNAKTTRNDNSSRFGKYLQVHLDRGLTITGAALRTYLLERCRVVAHGTCERSYHVFYQLCSACCQRGGRSGGEMGFLDRLGLGPAASYLFLNQGDSVSIPGVDDHADFLALNEAMGLVGLSAEQKADIFSILAAILHLGNIELVANDDDSCTIDSHDCHLTSASTLLGTSPSFLQKWLCNKLIVMETESIITPLKLSQSLSARDGLAKHLYARLFEWIVEAVNGRLCSGASPHGFVGVLDIYGFEVFQVNSFEQFCINYANEKLQQQFNLHVFKLEQEEYVREGIDWSVISYHDNQPCIDLIEGKFGILSQIDETCRLPGGCDDMLIQMLYKKLLSKGGSQGGVDHFFGKPRTSRDQFIIYHFADQVTYTVEGFVEKNVDRLIPEHLTMLRSSSSPFLAAMFKINTPAPDPHGNSKQRKGFLGRKLASGGVARGGGKSSARQSVGAQFKDSLSQLMNTLSRTVPHYIRCIKPNDCKEPFLFDPLRAVQQLRACGVLETIKISARGFPSRWTYDDFFHRYRLLLPWGQVRPSEPEAMSVRILKTFVPEEDKYFFGKTKIFFRAGQVAYLERSRSDRLHSSSVAIQRRVRGWIQRRRYLRLRAVAVALQAHCRGWRVRRVVEALKRTRAAVAIQAWFRCCRRRLQYSRLRQTVLCVQRHARGRLARTAFRRRILEKNATTIQKAARGWLARREYRRALLQVVQAQCCVRQWLARRTLKKLKTEARSVDHMKQLNRGLELKIIQLQQKLIEKGKLAEQLQSSRLEVQTWKARASEAEAELKMTCSELLQNNSMVAQLTEELKGLRLELAQERRNRALEKEELVTELESLRNKVLQLESMPAHQSTPASSAGRKDRKRLADQDGLRPEGVEVLVSDRSPSLEGEEEGYYSSRQSETEVGDLQLEIQELRQKHQKLINEYISLQNGTNQGGISDQKDTPTSPILIDALQSEVTRLMGENLSLWECVEETSTQTPTVMSRQPKTRRSIRGQKRGSYYEDDHFLGMFSFQPEDVNSILKSLVLDAVPGKPFEEGNPQEIPCFPAHVIYMCVRYVDHCSNQELMEDLMEAVINSIQQVTRRHAQDLDYLSFWLANTTRLCHSLQQLPGQETCAGQSKAGGSREFGLVNFELGEFRHILEQKATAVYMEVSRIVLLQLEPLVVPALLEDNPLPELPSVPSTPSKKNSGAGGERLLEGEATEQPTLELFLEKLSEVLQTLQLNGVDPRITALLMSHVFQMINAHVLNNLLLRKDVCHWTKGIQISFALSQLEDWCHESNLGNCVSDQLQPVKEATKLLQLRRTTRKDADSVVDLCSHLTSLQVQKLLTMYTPGDFEGKIPTALIRLIGEKCRKRDGGSSGRDLLVHIEDSPPSQLTCTPLALNYKKFNFHSKSNLDKLMIKI